ncbi:MAG: hypothetical protein AB7F28_06555 [Candidatus Margulisiibacteriota bacterium]
MATSFLKRSGLLLGLLLGVAPLAAEPLSPSDLNHLQIRHHQEHFLVETYFETEPGLTNTFGYQFDTSLTPQIDLILSIFGAIGGNRGGYGIAAVGLGYHTPIWNTVAWHYRASVGSGGGGGLPAGGGLVVKAETGLWIPLMDTLCVDLDVGYLTYPTGSFGSTTVSLGISVGHSSLFLPF